MSRIVVTQATAYWLFTYIFWNRTVFCVFKRQRLTYSRQFSSSTKKLYSSSPIPREFERKLQLTTACRCVKKKEIGAEWYSDSPRKVFRA
jgi:hypothetical protein